MLDGRVVLAGSQADRQVVDVHGELPGAERRLSVTGEHNEGRHVRSAGHPLERRDVVRVLADGVRERLTVAEPMPVVHPAGHSEVAGRSVH